MHQRRQLSAFMLALMKPKPLIGASELRGSGRSASGEGSIEVAKRLITSEPRLGLLARNELA